jgi:hypothetical protein
MVRIRRGRDGYAVAIECDWLPGIFETAQDALQAAKDLRWIGIPDDQPAEPT